jgi:hypothetical protein
MTLSTMEAEYIGATHTAKERIDLVPVLDQ